MKSSYNTITSESNVHHSDHHHQQWSSTITCSPNISPPPSSSATTQFAFPDLQNNKISGQLAANLDMHTVPSSSSTEAQVPLHKSTHASSISTGSDFEFDSWGLLEINDDPPVSPKLVCPSAAASYWGGLSNNGRLEVITPQISPHPSSPPHTPVIKARQEPSAPSSPPHTPVIKARQEPSAPSSPRHNPVIKARQEPSAPSPPRRSPVIKARQEPSAPPSPSMRQLMAEEMRGDHKGYNFDFYLSSSAPQTPKSQQKQGGAQLVKQRLSKQISSLRGIINNDQKSAVLDRRALDLPPLMIQNQVYLAGRLESNPHLSSSSSSSSSNGSSAVHPMDANEKFDQRKSISMDQAATVSKSIISMDQAATVSKSIKKHSNNSYKKWAFKDFLRRTVPSSKADIPHHNPENPRFNSPRQSTSRLMSSPKPYYLTSGLSKSAPISPAASPPRSRPSAATRAGHPSPTRSPPRPPMSPHALHYKQQKAQSDELRKKTFLPYRQSLLGCLGGAFPPTMSDARALQQHAW